MRVINLEFVNLLDLPNESFTYANMLTEKTLKILEDNYHIDLQQTIIPSQISQIYCFLHAYHFDIEGLAALDLGGGSKEHNDPGRHSFLEREPWRSRALHYAGGKPILLDIGDNIGEPYECHVVDLLEKDCLSFMAAGSIKVAFAIQLFNSPTLYRIHGRDAGRRLHDNIIPQLERIIAPGGCFIFYD